MFKNNQSQDMDQMKKEREVLIQQLLPDGSVEPLAESEECLLCIGETINKKDCYAFSDLGHEEPKGTKTSALGIKVNTAIGTILPIEIACCRKCKRNHQAAGLLPVIVMVLTMGVGLVFLGIPSFSLWLDRINEALPLIFFVILIPIGYLLGQMIKIAYINAKSRQTIFDVFEIPFLDRMKNAGWFSIYGKNKEAKLIFSKTRLKNSAKQ